MEGTNVIFEVTKVGFAVNNKWNVFVDNKVIGKIDFKKNLTQKLSKGRHTVQYKVGVQKTKVLEIDVGDSEIIVECVWDGTVRNFHVVGGENNSTINNISTISENKPNNEDYMYCSKCGTKISKESTFCNKCGNKTEHTSTQTINENQNTSNTTQTETNNTNSNTEIIFKILRAVIPIIIIIVGFWHIYGGNGVDGEYWFSDGSGYVRINKDTNRIYFYDEYNSAKGTTSVKFTDNKTFVYSDGLLEYTGTINGKKLTVKCENDKMGSFEATKK